MTEDTTKSNPGGYSFFRSDHREPPAVTPGLESGKVVGDFELRSLLGQGGMGQVWEATQRSLARQVAVKFVRPERVTDHQLELFAREARAGGRLSHAGIVAVYGHGESDGLAWIAMELIPGAWDLRDFLDEAVRMGEVGDGYDKRVAQFVAETADAIYAAHEAGVVHRDLKPQNILITEEDRPKVTDFGLARIVDEQALSRTGDFAGTYFYMSPEQVAAKRAGLDHRTDVFSLGVVLYEMLCLQRPFQGDTEHQIAEQILIKEPPPLRAIRSKVPRDLAVICGKAMEKDRDKRYQSMGDLAADLRRWLSSQPIQATPPTAIDRGVKWARRNPTKSATGALSLVAIFALSWLGFDLAESNEALKTSNSALIETTAESELQSDRAGEAEKLANQRSYSASLYASQMALDAGNLGEARRLLELCPVENRDWEWNHLKLTADPSLYVLAGHTDDVTATEWSPDGSKIVSSSLDKTVRVWDANTGECLQILSGHLAAVNDVCWSPDGTQIVSASSDKTLRLWDAFNGESMGVLKGQTGAVTKVSWGGFEGKQIASIEYNYLNPVIRIWDSVTKECSATLEGHVNLITSIDWSPDGLRLVSCSWVGRLQETEDRPGFKHVGQEKSLLIWDVAERSYVEVLPHYDSALIERRVCLAWSPKSNLIAIGGSRGRVEVFDVESMSLTHEFTENSMSVEFVVWSDDGNRLSFPTAAGDLRIWSLEDGTSRNIRIDDESINCASWSLDGAEIVTDSDGGTLRIWHSSFGDSAQALKGDDVRFGVEGLGVNVDGTRLLSSSRDGFHRMWDLTNGARIFEIEDFSRPSFAWNPNGTRYLTSPRIRSYFKAPIKLRDSVTGAVLNTLGGAEGNWGHAVWSPDGRSIAAILHNEGGAEGPDLPSSAGSTVCIWNAETGERNLTFELEGRASSLAWNSKSTLLASATAFHAVEIWDAESGDRLKSLDDGPFGASCVAWSPDGSKLLAGSIDKTVLVWDVLTERVLHELRGHTDRVLCVAWSPSGTRFVSGSEDATLKIWDSSNGENLLTLKRHEDIVSDVEWSSDGTRIFSASLDSTVRIWESQLDDALSIWRYRHLTQKLERIVEELFSAHASLISVQSAIYESDSIASEHKGLVIEIASSIGARHGASLNTRAWRAVDPDRPGFVSDVVEALQLAQEASLFAPSSPDIRDTLAWAFLENGLYDEAIAESKRALKLASEESKQSYEESLNRIRDQVDAARAKSASDK
jgi:WD40 repeat protein